MPASSDMAAVGDKLATCDELTSCVFEYSQAHGHAFRVKRKDRNYLNFDCPEAECEWKVNAKYSAPLNIRVLQAKGEVATAEWVSRVLEEKVAAQFDYGPKQAAADLRTFRDYAVPKRTIERGLEMAKVRELGCLESSTECLPRTSPICRIGMKACTGMYKRGRTGRFRGCSGRSCNSLPLTACCRFCAVMLAASPDPTVGACTSQWV